MPIKGLSVGRNKLVYPGGRNPGVDTSHPMAALLRFSAVCSIAGNYFQVNKFRAGTLNATAPTFIIDPIMGPVGVFTASTSSSGVSFAATGNFTGTEPTQTIGCIFGVTASPSATSCPFNTGSNDHGFFYQISTGRVVSIELPSFTAASPGFAALTIGHPYFYAASCITGLQNHCLLDLRTGQLKTATTSTAFTAAAAGTFIQFGGWASNSQTAPSTNVAVAACSGTFLSMQQLVQWAADPWSFWYPDRTFAISQVFMDQAPQGAAVIDVPLGFTPRTWVPGWSPTRALLLNTAQDFSSSAVETNPHWQGKTYPPQWLVDRKLLINHRAVVESSSAVETNPHTAFKTLPPQWVKNPILLLNTAQDFSSSAVETNPHWKGIQWPPQWQINRPLFMVTAQDFSASAVETNVHTVFRTWLPQWQPLAKLRQNDPQDFSSSAVETNPHWLGKTWPPQWSLILKQSFDPNSSTQVQPETNIHFIPRTYPTQWAPLKNLQNTAQDFSSSAVETNVHTIFKTWQSQWKQTIGLLLNTDTLAPTFQPETNVHTAFKTWPPQWVLLLRTQNTAQDFSSSAVETNPHWAGRSWPTQWSPAIILRTASATDVPAITFDTPPHTVFRTWLPQWLASLPLLRGTAQDFSSTAVETNVHFIPHTWPPQWNLQASLKQGTAQDFSTTPPAFVEIYENQFFSAFARIGAIGRNP